MLKRFVAIVAVALGSPLLSAADMATDITPAQRTFFEAKIRPLFIDKCFKCHSNAEGKVKGQFAMDTREALRIGGQHGAALVPGNPGQSRLIIAVNYNDPDLQMPPKGEKLTEQQIADLTTWVKMGAPDPRAGASGKLTGLNDKARAHWAYQPVKPQTVPTPKTSGWVRTPVDSFILKKLEEKGLKPAEQASKAVLLRRASYDLIGLPPTLDEVKAFIADDSPNAYEKVVDRLLASPHYGERWGRYWLDTARYADTAGQDVRYNDYRYVFAWTYRDYVIKAFNSDKPYDRFLLEQIAADLLPDSSANPDSLSALGFLTVGKKFLNFHETIAERIDTLTKATQSVTVACARCHDHKFDPIPTGDYYSLHGIFTSFVEPIRKPVVHESEDPIARQDYYAKLADLEQRNRDAYYKYVQTKSSAFRAKASAYLEFTVHNRKGKQKNQLERIRLLKEHELDQEVYQGIKYFPQTDAVMGPYTRFTQLGEEDFAEKSPAALKDLLTGYLGNKQKFPIHPVVLAALKETFADKAPQSMKDVCDMYGKIFAGVEDQAKAYIKANSESKDGKITGFDDNTIALIEIPLNVAPANELDTVGLLEVVKKLPLRNGNYSQFLFADIGELNLTHPGAPSRAMVVEDLPKPKDSPVFIRGEPGSPGPVMPHRYLECISGGKDRQVFKTGSGRLELAEAIASKSNPLTARAMVNRIWLHHFGEGFVRTPEDLGVMSEPPSNPQLFDWLSQRFMDDNWSIKKMHKLIMMSAAYQQSGMPDKGSVALGTKLDPENRMLWHANLRRLDFEALRDSMLVYCGSFDTTVGGHPVNLTEEPFSYRRSVYGYIDRGAVPELLSQFDFSEPDMPNSQRATTSVPQQALFFMNSPFSADIARKLVRRSEFLAAKDEAARVKVLFDITLQRDARPQETKFCHEFLASYPPAVLKQAEIALTTPPKSTAAPAKVAPMKKGRADFNRGVINEGTYVERKPLNPWEELAQTLLFTNDVSYVD